MQSEFDHIVEKVLKHLLSKYGRSFCIVALKIHDEAVSLQLSRFNINHETIMNDSIIISIFCHNSSIRMNLTIKPCISVSRDIAINPGSSIFLTIIDELISSNFPKSEIDREYVNPEDYKDLYVGGKNG